MNHSRTSSFESFNSNCSSKSGQSIWKRLSNIFHLKSRSSSRQSSIYSRRLSGGYSNSSLSNTSANMMDENRSHKQRHLKQYVQPNTCTQQMVIPPFSPTYCKTNEFPYSNFYVKLPDGRWMVRYRDGNRDILRTDIMEGYMI